MDILGMRLRETRKTRKIRQEDLAEKGAGVQSRTWRAYENGSKTPSLATLIKIADFLNVSIDYLVGRTNKIEVNR